MKHSVMLIVMHAVLSGAACAQSPDQIIQQANELYQKGKFGEARDLYETVRANGYESGELYYNLGNAYYKAGNVARAIVNYERALKLMPNDDDLLHNLKLANLMITDKIEQSPRLFIWDYWDALKRAFALNVLIWFAYAMFALTMVSLSGLILSRTFGGRRMTLIGVLTFGALCIGGTGIAVTRYFDLEQNDTAIVTASIATIKNSPDSNSTDAFVLHSGVKVQITDRVNQWVKIRLADGKVGWMEIAAAEVI